MLALRAPSEYMGSCPARKADDPEWRHATYFSAVQLTSARREWYRDWRRTHSRPISKVMLANRRPLQQTEAALRAASLDCMPMLEVPDWMTSALRVGGALVEDPPSNNELAPPLRACGAHMR
ncbi:hypothetical protein PsYK624_136830 [Phanerochaete sordida]|uniref:Uncharacterized protein n=1 Tax=Phanerochaete sordida TaxID=48140 RepID=A0A9P3GL29_9APHY|nr:hypothetical protein PsYK624_136830 [Phanerochaete sordida]